MPKRPRVRVPPSLQSSTRLAEGHRLASTLQDQIADALKAANGGAEHGQCFVTPHFTFVPAMRLSEPAMNSCTPTSSKPAAPK
jgi:hypothetical protein